MKGVHAFENITLFLVKKILLTISIAVMAALIAIFSGPAMAKVTGACENCHTMHNSQGGTAGPSGVGYESLLAKECVECHSSSESSTYDNRGGCLVPIVFYTGNSAPIKYLAGGNFWWVKEGEGAGNDDSKGHNVFFREDDADLSEGAPGGLRCSANSCHANLSQPDDSGGWGEGFKGRYGCQGCHLYVKHHASDHPNGEGGLVTTAEQGWYRFLARHTNNNGVRGYEDGDWEAGHPDLPQGTTGHNEYRGAEGLSGLEGDAYSTTGFCTGCHGDFHSQKSDGKWIRHPSDAVIPDKREYAGLGGGSRLYDPLSPVAKATVDTPDGTVTPGSDMVMCLSCHRPHGSPYPDLLRWDYRATEAQGGGEDNGCFYCHTQKNNV